MRMFTREVCLAIFAWNLGWVALALNANSLLGVG